MNGADVLINAVQVWHPSWYLYNQCSLKAGDLWLFSVYCHLPSFSGSFPPSASKLGHIKSDNIPAYLRWQAETVLSQFSTECHVFPRDVPRFLPLSASAHRGLSFGSWIFHAGVFAWFCVTPSPGRLKAASHLNFALTLLRQNRSETSMLAGIVIARAVLFQGVAPHILAVGQLDTNVPHRQLQTGVGLHFLMFYLHLSQSHSAAISQTVLRDPGGGLAGQGSWHMKVARPVGFRCANHATYMPALLITSRKAACFERSSCDLCQQILILETRFKWIWI